MRRVFTGIRAVCLTGMLMAVTAGLCSAQQVLYSQDFEGLPGSALPPEWISLGGNWIITSDDTAVLQQSDPAFRGTAYAGIIWANYDVTATITPDQFNGQWGVGLVGYWQSDGNCYRLSSYGNVVALWRERDGKAQALAAVHMELVDQPYRFRLSLTNSAEATTIRGKIWNAADTEPDEWLLSGIDATTPLRFGRAGLFTGRAAASFSDFAVLRQDGEKRILADDTLVSDAAAAAGHWLYLGGNWQPPAEDRPLRQALAGNTPGFFARAYAIAAGWSDYTVQVSARSAPGSQNQGFGICAYWQDSGNFYQFGQAAGSSLFIARRSQGARPVFLATIPFNFEKGTWWMLKFRLVNTESGVRLLGKAWPARAGEPAAWQLETEDTRKPALLGGDVALWSIDDVCSFDDIVVTRNE